MKILHPALYFPRAEGLQDFLAEDKNRSIKVDKKSFQKQDLILNDHNGKKTEI